MVDEFLDPDWYRQRYPDIAEANIDPHQHFVRYGAAERRDPNRFFDSAWYIEHYPDVAASGIDPLLHYAQAGAAELRHPHPKFDAVYYAEQHPDAAGNPLLYHLRVGAARGYLTEKPIDIRDYLPSERLTSPPPQGVFADVVIVVRARSENLARCLRSVCADRDLPLGRIIVVHNASTEREPDAWLQELAAEGQIHLIRSRRRLGFAGLVRLGIDAAEGHDVALLGSDAIVPVGWLRRLMAHAYVRPNIATVSPFSDHSPIRAKALNATPQQIDAICRTVNAGRSVDVPLVMSNCGYIRRAALVSAGEFGESDFASRTTAAGWRHRLACDTFIPGGPRSGPAAPRAAAFSSC